MSTTQPTTTIGKAANFAETRVGASVLVREFGRKIFPSHWSFMLGEVALYSFIIVVLSGTFLTFFFQPAMGELHYDGPWLPLRGVEISEAYDDSGDLAGDPRRSVHSTDAPLGRSALRRCLEHPHAACVLHRCVPSPA